MWPAWLASVFLVGMLLPDEQMEYFLSHRSVLFVIGNSIILFGQAVLTFRLVRKNYRWFWIGVVHEGEPLKRRFLPYEYIRVALQILLLHVAVLSAVSLLFLFMPISAETVRRLNSFGQLFRVLVIGPAAIRWGMHVNYRGFRLQAYRRKRKSDSWSSLRHLEGENDSGK
jgi:hypothetical protein